MTSPATETGSKTPWVAPGGSLDFGGRELVGVRATFLGQRIDTRSFEGGTRLASAPLVLALGQGGCVVVFRYGVVVCCGLERAEEVAFHASLVDRLIEPFANPETEPTQLFRIEGDGDRVQPDGIALQTVSVPRIQLVASVLAKSVVLAHYEKEVSERFDRVGPLAEHLRIHGRVGAGTRDLMRRIGDILAIQAKTVGPVEVREKPDLLWDAPELGRFYSQLMDEYEIDERQVALDRKMELVAHTASTLLALVQNRRSLRVEWIIVALILAEILISLVERWG